MPAAKEAGRRTTTQTDNRDIKSRLTSQRPTNHLTRHTDASPNPERFEQLHSVILETISRLEETFDVVRVELYGLDEELEGKRGIVRPSVQLTPVDSTAAPITVTFSDFPGLFVRFGRWVTEPFPSCGCDACDESATDEIERLTRLIDIVTAGGFREAVKIPRRTSRERCLAGTRVPRTGISTLWQIPHPPHPRPPNVRRSPPPTGKLAPMAPPTDPCGSLTMLCSAGLAGQVLIAYGVSQ